MTIRNIILKSSERKFRAKNFKLTWISSNEVLYTAKNLNQNYKLMKSINYLLKVTILCIQLCIYTEYNRGKNARGFPTSSTSLLSLFYVFSMVGLLAYAPGASRNDDEEEEQKRRWRRKQIMGASDSFFDIFIESLFLSALICIEACYFHTEYFTQYSPFSFHFYFFTNVICLAFITRNKFILLWKNLLFLFSFSIERIFLMRTFK